MAVACGTLKCLALSPSAHPKVGGSRTRLSGSAADHTIQSQPLRCHGCLRATDAALHSKPRGLHSRSLFFVKELCQEGGSWLRGNARVERSRFRSREVRAWGDRANVSEGELEEDEQRIPKVSGGGGGSNGAASPSVPSVSASSLNGDSLSSPPPVYTSDAGEVTSATTSTAGDQSGTSGFLSGFLANVPRRFVVVGLCFFAFLLCNMDRVNMSIAILPMSTQYNWSPTTVGLVQSSFFWGYLLTQILGGIWADKFGGKMVLGFGVIWWSIATMMTPIAAQLGLPALLFARACMGVGEGVAMPSMNNLLSKWVPVRERSRSLALVYSGMYLGSVIGLGASPTFIHNYGWPSVFYGFGSLGALWFMTWQSQAASTPAEDPLLTAPEREMIAAGTSGSTKLVEKIPWGLILSKPPVWALILSHFCHNWGVFILLTWMPTYYHQVLGFNLAESGVFSVLPWLTMAASANFGGWIADTLITKGYSVTFVRKLMQTIGFLGPAACLTLLSHVGMNPTLAILCMMGSQGLDAFSQSGLYSNHQDIGPRYAGVLLGLSNTAGVLAGGIGTGVTGYILQNGSWDDVFRVAVGLYLLGAVIWNVAATGERVFD